MRTAVVLGVLAWAMASGTAFAQRSGAKGNVPESRRLGDSAILHLMAAHPKVVAALGIVATVAAITPANGPQNYLGSGQQMRRMERTVTASHMVTDEDVVGAADIAARLADEPNEEIEPLVRDVLRQCGVGCANLTPAIVMRDEELLHSALTVWELERRSPDIRSLRGNQIAGLLTTGPHGPRWGDVTSALRPTARG